MRNTYNWCSSSCLLNVIHMRYIHLAMMATEETMETCRAKEKTSSTYIENWTDLRSCQSEKKRDMNPNLRPMEPQLLVMFRGKHPTLVVLNFHPYLDYLLGYSHVWDDKCYQAY